MKTRVISVRVRYDTLALCYKMQELAGLQVHNMPVGRMVSDTLEAVIETARRFNKMNTVSEQEAEELFEKYAVELPGIEVDVVSALREAKATAAEKENGSGPKTTEGKPTDVPLLSGAGCGDEPRLAEPVFVSGGAPEVVELGTISIATKNLLLLTPRFTYYSYLR